MRVIAQSRLLEYAKLHPSAKPALTRFYLLAETCSWRSFTDLKKTYNHADQCKVASGRTVQIINIQKNKFRLVVAIHFDRGLVFIRHFMTHAEYSKNHWKNLH